MRIAYFDCFSGISGDMTLGALVGAGWPREALMEIPRRIKLDGVQVLEGPPVVAFESSEGGTRIVFTMPPVEAPGLAYIVVDGEDEYWNSAAEFAFQGDAAAGDASEEGDVGPTAEPSDATPSTDVPVTSSTAAASESPTS